MPKITTVEDLEVFQRSYKLALEVHKITLEFPPIDRYELGQQIRRASKSIPTNIAEGFSRRKFTKEYLRYLGMARGSAGEMQIHLQFARDLGYISTKLYAKLSEEYIIVGKQLSALMNTWSKFS